MIVKLKNVGKKYSDTGFHLDDINFSLDKSEVLGLIGQNGSGKSTILKMIAGLISYDSGEIVYQDRDISSMNEKEIRKMRRQVGSLTLVR